MPNGDLFIIGGNEDKQGDKEILSRFIDLSGGSRARIGLATTATHYPDEVGAEYGELFQELGAAPPHHFRIRTREEADHPEHAAKLAKLDSIFITGGDQVRLTSILGGTAFFSALRTRWHEGMLIAGTSAGAAVMSRHMIMYETKENESERLVLEMGPGFGFLEDVIIDQHFSQRARFSRLMLAIARNPQIVGVGIDENTAIWVKEEGRIFEVLGKHGVTVFDGNKLLFVDLDSSRDSGELTLSGIRLHSLAAGYSFNLETRDLILTKGESKDEH